MHTAYLPELTQDSKEFTLSPEESNHCVKVMRMMEGNELFVVNGNGLLAKASILFAHHKKCQVIVSDFVVESPNPKPIHIAIAPTKMMDRMTWFVEKATELGVDKISLIKCANNERSVVKTEKLFKVALGAMKQSKRLFLPEIEELIDYKSFVKSNPNGFIAYTEAGMEKDKIALESSGINDSLTNWSGRRFQARRNQTCF